jgi:hypothetical protein
MKRIIAVAGLLLLSSSAWGEWERAGSNSGDGVESYMDRARVKTTPNGERTYWVLADFKAPQTFPNGTKYLSSKRQMRADCSADTVAGVYTIFYADHMGKGETISAGPMDGRVESIAPGSAGEAEAQFACR